MQKFNRNRSNQRKSMDRKIRTCIGRVQLNDKTYHQEVFYPTLVNVFYGSNGSGKSTIARKINAREGLTWETYNSTDIMCMIFNEEYIRHNVVSYDNIPGVFTLSSEEADMREKLMSAIDNRKQVEKELSDAENIATKIRGRKSFSDNEFYSKVWERTKTRREHDFPNTQDGFRNSKQKFFVELLNHTPAPINFEELRTAYTRVFNTEAMRYIHYADIDASTFPTTTDIVKKSLISKSDTDFAQFIRHLGNLDWVKEGKEQYLHDDMCPFCQSRIDKNKLIQNITACFDEQYQKDFEELKSFADDYAEAYMAIRDALILNKNNIFPISEIQRQNYQYYADMFIEKGQNNLVFLEQKLKEPSSEPSYEFEDLSAYLQKLVRYTDEINSSINDYLQVSGLSDKKNIVLNRVWSFMAYECQDLLNGYKQRKKQLDLEEKSNSDNLVSLEHRRAELNAEIERLTAHTTSTKVVMKEINKTLRGLGFNGFYLQEKEDTPYAYELVRENENGEKEIAQGLSEGERNFIAFLYFYHTITGSQNKDGNIDDKIVVIDDPVSSMDQQTMFYVATLTRKLIDICVNNVILREYEAENMTEKYIKQFFCFTHNAIFFREITYNRIADYEYVSFFKIEKDKLNHSHIIETYEEADDVGHERLNVSPVQNYYESLWHVFKTTDSQDILMIVAHQILSHHFLQNDGYNAEDLRNILFSNENETEFLRKSENGGVDHTLYDIAVSMISMFGTGITGYNDGMSFSSSAYTLEQIREALSIIFEVMGRTSHYNLMMRKK